MSDNLVQMSFTVKEDSMIMKAIFYMMVFGEEDKNGINDNLLNHHLLQLFKYIFFCNKVKK